MKYIYTFKKIKHASIPGFVLPYTLFVASIMIVITSSVCAIIIKQIYFSRLARQSKIAYYAADAALLCTTMIDSTYTDANGIGIFPYDVTSINYLNVEFDMDATIAYTSTHRLNAGPLATTRASITCAQSAIFDVAVSGFHVNSAPFSRVVPAHDLVPTTTELGRTSMFNMKMPIGDGTFRCAKVTVNKTPTYRQIISQGYAVCGKPDGSVERAVVDTTITQ